MQWTLLKKYRYTQLLKFTAGAFKMRFVRMSYFKRVPKNNILGPITNIEPDWSLQIWIYYDQERNYAKQFKVKLIRLSHGTCGAFQKFWRHQKAAQICSQDGLYLFADSPLSSVCGLSWTHSYWMWRKNLKENVRLVFSLIFSIYCSAHRGITG